MPSSRFGLSLAALGPLLLAACAGQDDRPLGDESYLPHPDGFSWTYRFTRDTAAPELAVARFEGTESIQGVTAQRLTLTSSLVSGHVLVEVRPDRLRLYSTTFFGSTALYDPPLDLLSLPFTVGDRFHLTSRVLVLLLPVDLTLQTTVEAFGSVTAAGRTYQEAFRLRSIAEVRAGSVAFQATATTWLAPASGAVRAEILLPGNPIFPLSGQITAEATSIGP